MICTLCNNTEFETIHKGTRDVQKINVMRCAFCGLVQLDDMEYNTEENYADGGMLKENYVLSDDNVADVTWNQWVQQSEPDDERRFHDLIELCRGKKVLDFGCGNGGFLRRIKEVTSAAVGIELMDEARRRLAEEKIVTYKTLDDTDEEYDVIVSFNVIEHLNNPDEILKSIFGKLKKGGLFVCETANVDCALSQLYKCHAYEDFTYWSEHVILYNSATLEKMINRNGFVTQWNTQKERYSLANHLFWLSNGKPGGHGKWMEFNEKEMNEIYEKILVKKSMADTLWYGGIKK